MREIVQKAINYIEQADLTRADLTIDGLCKTVSPSPDPSLLAEHFAIVTGDSVENYVRTFRIKTALDIQIKTGRKRKEVAQAVGYTDDTMFARDFKAITGQSFEASAQRYSAEIRRNRAHAMIALNPSMRYSDVAKQLGYEDVRALLRDLQQARRHGVMHRTR